MKDNLREWSSDKRVPHVFISPTSLFQTKLTNNLAATSICCHAASCFPSKKPQVACLFLRGRRSHPGIGAGSYSADCVSVTSVCFKSKGRTVHWLRHDSHSGTYSKEMESVLTSVSPNIETSGDVFSNLSGDPERLFSLFLYKT